MCNNLPRTCSVRRDQRANVFVNRLKWKKNVFSCDENSLSHVKVTVRELDEENVV